MEPVLQVKNLSRHFGGLTAVANVSFDIQPGELIGLIGPNGAGKTTLFNLLTGVYEPSEGLIEMDVDGKPTQIGGLPPYKITDLGVARTFQNIRLFKEMTVLENVKVAMHRNIRYGVISAILRLPKYYSEERWVEEKACEYLKEVGLYAKRNELSVNLPYGEQRKLEIARALAIQPKILYLDEPAAGMNPQETADLTALIHRIRKKYGLTVILIEHDMSLVMKICERIFVLDYGKLIASGSPEEIRKNEFVIKAYLGEEI
ncbi:ABC transporter ATP-binding protein [Faecalibaculum rodentium]|uniref:ABC transporter ATP-binding protein n=1 Tax=Faecalibaculum rodentium TaxID=1702221 RepID=UPI0023F43EF4|nr:ABC transporter ATP-binding protein [Faecalibaculum rodentium]